MTLVETPGLVSVVLPTRGRPVLLREAVESVVAQSYGDIELLVVNGGDAFVEAILDDVGVTSLSAVRCLADEGAGVAAARNIGIEAARGEFIAFLDDDDRWLPELVERLVATLTAGGDEVGFVYAGQRYVDGGETLGRRTPTTRGAITRQLIEGAPLCPTSSVMVRASVVEEAGTFDERFPVWEDREWYVRLSQHCLVEAIPEPLVVRRAGDHDQLTDEYEPLRDVAYPLFVEKHRPLAASFGPEYERKLVSNLSMGLAMSAFVTGYYTDSLAFLARSTRYDPTLRKLCLYLPLFLGGRPALWTARTVKRLRRKLLADESGGSADHSPEDDESLTTVDA